MVLYHAGGVSPTVQDVGIEYYGLLQLMLVSSVFLRSGTTTSLLSELQLSGYMAQELKSITRESVPSSLAFSESWNSSFYEIRLEAHAMWDINNLRNILVSFASSHPLYHVLQTLFVLYVPDF